MSGLRVNSGLNVSDRAPSGSGEWRDNNNIHAVAEYMYLHTLLQHLQYVPDAGRAYQPKPNAPLVSGIRIVTRDAWAYLLILLMFFLLCPSVCRTPYYMCIKKLVIQAGNYQRDAMQCHVDNRLVRYYHLRIKICSENKKVAATANCGPENHDCSSIDNNNASLRK